VYAIRHPATSLGLECLCGVTAWASPAHHSNFYRMLTILRGLFSRTSDLLPHRHVY
jgi:hypothetical protein